MVCGCYPLDVFLGDTNVAHPPDHRCARCRFAYLDTFGVPFGVPFSVSFGARFSARSFACPSRLSQFAKCYDHEPYRSFYYYPNYKQGATDVRQVAQEGSEVFRIQKRVHDARDAEGYVCGYDRELSPVFIVPLREKQ